MEIKNHPEWLSENKGREAAAVQPLLSGFQRRNKFPTRIDLEDQVTMTTEPDLNVKPLSQNFSHASVNSFHFHVTKHAFPHQEWNLAFLESLLRDKFIFHSSWSLVPFVTLTMDHLAEPDQERWSQPPPCPRCKTADKQRVWLQICNPGLVRLRSAPQCVVCRLIKDTAAQREESMAVSTGQDTQRRANCLLLVLWC